jgi:hypothetical protein
VGGGFCPPPSRRHVKEASEKAEIRIIQCNPLATLWYFRISFLQKMGWRRKMRHSGNTRHERQNLLGSRVHKQKPGHVITLQGVVDRVLTTGSNLNV